LASVGIAKLSLWLQTAKRDRPLSNLMGNIKSAIDVVIGNPPYVRQESIKELLIYLYIFMSWLKIF